MPIPTIVVAGTHSGCGKTTVTLGLLAALVRRGLTVQAFKCGPDFIDPGHHAAVTGRPSHNLDGWMMDQKSVRHCFERATQDADIAVVEGVMGLFDGRSASEDDGSTAQIAKWLGASVLLVVDARSMARSAAALVAGYTGFDPQLNFAGIALNRVGSDNHASILEEAIRKAPAHLAPLPPVRGVLRRSEDLSLPSRHLGLHMADDSTMSADRQNALAAWVEKGMDLETLLAELPHCGGETQQDSTQPKRTAAVRIGVARDRAFCFYYHDNLRLLEEAGAELVPFSPLTDSALPENIHGLYLGGGYPELFAPELEKNQSIRQAIAQFSHADGPIYAECGGFMLTMQGICDAEGQRSEMTGIFPFEATMEKRFRALGYRGIRTRQDSPIGPAGTTARGHEFHYSAPRLKEGTHGIYEVSDRKGPRSGEEGFVVRNTLASYIHLHFASNPECAAAFVRCCSNWKAAQENKDSVHG
ncbi:cobyrinate a,c-diamide synthase [Desulfobaculum bizertense]|uniref:Cobyrinate a,c-diamide synthase n=1 Tax=Desulfobaculum bizertense DSM 18034 TaxID=1121442 RepID=A0A1T4WCJ6_9BACT|nr:cobyrinate a,c-diamide synthase [Desulfobaculum bizertense]SKA74829.1 cobyrinic acid a,c-diamide synthase [Desulfobaculum bizertense DSM 18034]